MIQQLRSFNDKAVKLLSHPFMVGMWWTSSFMSLVWLVTDPSEVSATLMLSFLALAYGSAIAEKQVRTEDRDEHRNNMVHAKLDTLISAIPEADDNLQGAEKVVDKQRVDKS